MFTVVLQHCNVVTVGNGMPKTALINRLLDEIDEHERKVVRLEGEQRISACHLREGNLEIVRLELRRAKRALQAIQ